MCMAASDGSPTLGVGLTYLASRPREMRKLARDFDFFELDPQVLCRQVGVGPDDAPRLVLRPDVVDDVLDRIAPRPVVLHGAGLSLGAPQGLDTGYLDMLATLESVHPFAWHSEHLAFSSVEGPFGACHIGAPLPLPLTVEAVQMIAERAPAVRAHLDCPLLLENAMSWFADLPHDPDWDLAVFLNEVCRESGCGLLLDLDDFADYCWLHHLDPRWVLERLDLSLVEQIHVAGRAAGANLGIVVRTHVEVEAVWGLLDLLVKATPNLRGVVYELSEVGPDAVGVDAITDDLARLHRIAHQSGQTGAPSWH